MFRKKTALSLSRSFVTRIVRENIAKNFNISRNIFRVPAKKKTYETRNVPGTKNAPVKLSCSLDLGPCPGDAPPPRLGGGRGRGRAAALQVLQVGHQDVGAVVRQALKVDESAGGKKEKRKCGKTGTRILSYGIPVGAR